MNQSLLQKTTPENMKHQRKVKFFSSWAYWTSLLPLEYPKVGSKLQKLDFRKKTGRPNIENKIEEVREAILYIVVPDSFTDEHWRSDVYNSVHTLDDFHEALQKKWFTLSWAATYYHFLPAIIQDRDGKGNVYTVSLNLILPQNDLREKHPDGHFVMVLVKFVKNLHLYLAMIIHFFIPRWQGTCNS